MSLVFQMCFCCRKSFNISKLIELSGNSVVIGEETIDFVEIYLDVCFILIDPMTASQICEGCRNMLVNFHLFKRDCKKYSSFASNVNRLKVLLEIDEHLKIFDDRLPIQILKTKNEIIITAGSSQQEVAGETFSQEPMSHENMDDPGGFDPTNDSDMVEEEYIYESDQEMSVIPESHHEETLEISQTAESEADIKLKRPRTKKYKYPTKTNESLSDQQRDWICRQVRSCEKILGNGQTIYECSMCPTVLKIAGTLRKHLRDCHILKSNEELKIRDSQLAFKNEITQSKILIETKEGQQAIWKCQRCNSNRIFHSEAGLKFHIRFQHIRSGQIDSKFIAQCKIKAEDGKDTWVCPLEPCSKAMRSRDGLRNHIKLEHPETFKDQTTDDPPKHYQHPIQTLESIDLNRRSFKVEQLTCEECGVEFINGTSKKEKSHKNHLECHKILNVISIFYQLPKCDVSKVMFSNEDDLNKFLSTDQSYFESLPCEGMTSKVSRKVQMPMATGLDESAWKCGHCATKYLTDLECTAHIMIFHSKKLICPVDHLEFEGSRGISLFNHHMKNKHPEMFPDFQVTCTYCRENFQTIYERLSHMKICPEKKMQCDHCGKFFFTKSEVTRHIKIEFGILRYECEVCKKSCASTMDLKLHLASHTNVKSYICSYPDCFKAFKTPTARSSHMEKHSNTDFSCSNCPANFKQRTLLQRHVKKCMRNKPGNAEMEYDIVYV